MPEDRLRSSSESILSIAVSLGDEPESAFGMACNFLYRLIKFAGAQRVLFLVDRANLWAAKP